MFLKSLIKRNKQLVDCAIKLYKEGSIDPNSYVIDLDSVKKNAILIKKEADKYNINLYQMTKQFGRNPLLAQTIKNVGIKKAVCVDFQETETMHNAGLEMGNIGHLVQIPNNLISKFIKLKPDVITIFSLEKAKRINECAKKLGIVQNIIIKIYDDNDKLYEGQEGGIYLQNLNKVIIELLKMQYIKVVGFTSFPIFLLENKKIKTTNNICTIKQAVKIAEKNGIKISHINTPSANSVSTMKLIHELGGTHAEPGHAFTGTIPSNEWREEPEVPSILYISEISHFFKNKAYIFGGGFYPRGNIKNVLISSKNKIFYEKMNKFPADSIDYYLNFNINNHLYNVGDIAILSFRAQIFTSRSKVVIIKGLTSNKPVIAGVFSSQGEPILWNR